MNVWAVLGKLTVLGFDAAIAIDRWLDARAARRRRGLSFQDVKHQQDQIARATRSRAPTVTIPRNRAPRD